MEGVASTGEGADGAWMEGWLNGLNLSQYTTLFKDNGLEEAEVIATLTDQDLKDLGISLLGHRRKILLHLPAQSKGSGQVKKELSEEELAYVESYSKSANYYQINWADEPLEEESTTDTSDNPHNDNLYYTVVSLMPAGEKSKTNDAYSGGNEELNSLISSQSSKERQSSNPYEGNEEMVSLVNAFVERQQGNKGGEVGTGETSSPSPSPGGDSSSKMENNPYGGSEELASLISTIPPTTTPSTRKGEQQQEDDDNGERACLLAPNSNSSSSSKVEEADAYGGNEELASLISGPSTTKDEYGERECLLAPNSNSSSSSKVEEGDAYGGNEELVSLIAGPSTMKDEVQEDDEHGERACLLVPNKSSSKEIAYGGNDELASLIAGPSTMKDGLQEDDEYGERACLVVRSKSSSQEGDAYGGNDELASLISGPSTTIDVPSNSSSSSSREIAYGGNDELASLISAVPSSSSSSATTTTEEEDRYGGNDDLSALLRGGDNSREDDKNSASVISYSKGGDDAGNPYGGNADLAAALNLSESSSSPLSSPSPKGDDSSALFNSQDLSVLLRNTAPPPLSPSSSADNVKQHVSTSYSNNINNNRRRNKANNNAKTPSSSTTMVLSYSNPNVKKTPTLSVSSKPPDLSDSSSDSDSEDDDQHIKQERGKREKLATLDSGLLKLPHELAFFGTKFYWCENFGPLTEKLHSQSISLEKRARLLRKLAALEAEFVRTANMYGKIIITERFLPNEKKSITPIDIGGRAGGIKYIVEGILFKFAWDSEGIYGGDLNAMKAGSHELKSLKAIYHNLPEGIRVPMMVTIDFKGYKLLAISLLPVGKNSLIYGTGDGGATIHTKEPIINHRMAQLGKALNLKEHTAGKEKKKVCLPADIEVHRGADGKYYMLDFARLWPPETPTPGMTCSFLTRLLRGELVRANASSPLSSDAFSGFQSGSPEERKRNNLEVLAAFEYLQSTVIPEFVFALERNITDPTVIKNFAITTNMHDKGINVRHLGVLWCLFTNKQWKRRVLTEAAYRVAKNTIQSLMRKAMETIKMATDEPYLRLIVGYLNLLFGDTEQSTYYWKTELRWNLEKNFFYLGDCKRSLRKVKNIKKRVNLRYLFEKLPARLGIEMRKDLLSNLDGEGLSTQQVVVGENDILSISPVIHSGLSDHPRAFTLYQKAFYTKKKEAREEILMEAGKILGKSGMSQSSNHFLTFRYWAKVLLGIGSAKSNKEEGGGGGGGWPSFFSYTRWLIRHRLTNPSPAELPTWNSLIQQFLMDYLWILLATQELRDRDPKFDTEREEILDSCLLALFTIPADVAAKEAFTFLSRTLSGVGEEESGGVYKTGIFEKLDFDGFHFLTDSRLGDVISKISERTLGVRELKFRNCVLDDTNLIVSLARFGATLTVLELDIVDAVVIKDPIKEICERCPNLVRLVLKGNAVVSSEENKKGDWIKMISTSLHNLKELEVDFYWPFESAKQAGAGICTFLNQLRSLSFKDSGKFFNPSAKVESIALPSLESFHVKIFDARRVVPSFFRKMKQLRSISLIPCLDVLDEMKKYTNYKDKQLDSSALKPEDGIAMFEALANITPLKEFGMDFAAVAALAELQKENPNSDPFSLAGAMKLRKEAMKKPIGKPVDPNDVLLRIPSLVESIAGACSYVQVLELPCYCMYKQDLLIIANKPIGKNLRKISFMQFTNQSRELSAELDTSALQILLSLPSLESISIQRHSGAIGVSTFLSQTPKAVAPLTEFYIGGEMKKPFYGAKDWLDLFRHFKSLRRVGKLPADFSDELVGQMKEVMTSLEEVDLSTTRLSGRGLKRLLPSLKSLKKVILSVNNIATAFHEERNAREKSSTCLRKSKFVPDVAESPEGKGYYDEDNDREEIVSLPDLVREVVASLPSTVREVVLDRKIPKDSNMDKEEETLKFAAVRKRRPPLQIIENIHIPSPTPSQKEEDLLAKVMAKKKEKEKKKKGEDVEEDNVQRRVRLAGALGQDDDNIEGITSILPPPSTPLLSLIQTLHHIAQ